MYFCPSDNEKLKIGEIINNKFIPNIRIFEKSHDINFSKEVNFNNDNFNFIHDFIIEIIKYKLQNEKMDITEEDMKIIIQEYEKQNIKQKVKKINM